MVKYTKEQAIEALKRNKNLRATSGNKFVVITYWDEDKKDWVKANALVKDVIQGASNFQDLDNDSNANGGAGTGLDAINSLVQTDIHQNNNIATNTSVIATNTSEIIDLQNNKVDKEERFLIFEIPAGTPFGTDKTLLEPLHNFEFIEVEWIFATSSISTPGTPNEDISKYRGAVFNIRRPKSAFGEIYNYFGPEFEDIGGLNGMVVYKNKVCSLFDKIGFDGNEVCSAPAIHAVTTIRIYGINRII